MKASELMIGDWIRMNKYQNVRVSRLSEHSDYPNCEPIPLTPEILEKNGFIVKHPESEKRTYWRDATGTIVGHKNRGLMYMDITGNPERFGDFHPMFHGHIRYVHELQHALRLCGIEKEIEL